jgi:phenylalanyl-tRNA synthetase beta chain
MKFTLSWLKDHLDTSATLDEILKALNDVGLEVESVEDKSKALAPFLIARVASAVQHPNADKLRLCMVDTGAGELVQVVCGAPNAREGLITVFSPPGTYIPGKDFTIAIASVRGVESRGMLCSGAELQLTEDSDGILELPATAPVGTAYAAWAGLDDPIIDIAITPNRADCTGVRGVARDLAAAGLGTLKHDPVKPLKGSYVSPVKVELRFAGAELVACPAFYGRYVKGVKNGPSPEWLQKRLTAIGLRPISALVDMTNYISIDRGRPLHVYDAQKLNGTLHARYGKTGESFLALDGKTYAVDERMCVIADDGAVLGLGGIMGGEDSGCSEATTDVFIECAWFDPMRTAETGRRTGVVSDARYRFERGVDPNYLRGGMDYATEMVLQLCGGEPSEIVVAGEAPMNDRVITFPFSEVKRLSGLDVPAPVARGILERVGCVVIGDGASVKVSPPSWRADIHGKADLVEEVIRIHGLDNIKPEPIAPTGHVGEKVLTTLQLRRIRARRMLAARGMLEAVTWSFISRERAEAFGGGAGALALANPIAADLSDMRPSLLPGLLAAAKRNADRGFGDLALFEVGQVFKSDAPEGQKWNATGIRRGTAVMAGAGRHWQGASPTVSFMDVKADVIAVLEALGAPVEKLQVTRNVPGWYHPGRSAAFQLGPQTTLATFGEVHPKTLGLMDVTGPIVAFEIMLDAIPEAKAKPTKSKGRLDVSAFLPVSRDFAFVVKEEIEAEKILKAVRGADKALITDVQVFDIFRGAALGDGKKSVAIAVTLSPKDATLTDKDIEAVSGRIVGAVVKATGAELRG